MVKKTILSALIILICRLLSAQNYYFQVREIAATVKIDFDQTTISYRIIFYNEPGASPIDVIDVGLPNDHYDLFSARAVLNGQIINDIRHSEYVKPGVEIHLGSDSIQPGETKKLEFQIKQNRMIFEDEKDPRLASLQFKTTWYSSKFISRHNSAISITFILPPGSDANNCRYHNFDRQDYIPSGFVRDNRLYYQWNWINSRADFGYVAGASFPRDLVSKVEKAPRKNLLTLFIDLIKAFFIFFFTFLPILFIILPIILVARNRHLFNLKRGYLPPKIGMESGGIKMGLTVPEIALLQQQPLTKVLLLIIFGMVKKDILEIVEKDGKYLFFPKKNDNIELRAYEKSFIEAINKNNELDRSKLEELFKKFIKNSVDKMAGFSLKETLDYYQRITEKAWADFEKSGSKEIPAHLAEQLDWLMLDKKSEERLAALPIPETIWTNRGYWYGRMPEKIFTPSGKNYGQTISERASNLAKSFENFSSALVGNTDVFSSRIAVATNPPPVAPSHSGSSRSSGSGCACACACACAGCACACAGGGR